MEVEYVDIDYSLGIDTEREARIILILVLRTKYEGEGWK